VFCDCFVVVGLFYYEFLYLFLNFQKSSHC
jgi:hypothetical protein